MVEEVRAPQEAEEDPGGARLGQVQSCGRLVAVAVEVEPAAPGEVRGHAPEGREADADAHLDARAAIAGLAAGLAHRQCDAETGDELDRAARVRVERRRRQRWGSGRGRLCGRRRRWRSRPGGRRRRGGRGRGRRGWGWRWWRRRRRCRFCSGAHRQQRGKGDGERGSDGGTARHAVRGKCYYLSIPRSLRCVPSAFRSVARGSMMVRRLPVLQNPAPGDADDQRPPWHWVLIGAGFVFTLWIPLAIAAQWLSRMLAASMVDLADAEAVAHFNATAPTGQRVLLSAVLLGPAGAVVRGGVRVRRDAGRTLRWAGRIARGNTGRAACRGSGLAGGAARRSPVALERRGGQPRPARRRRVRADAAWRLAGPPPPSQVTRIMLDVMFLPEPRWTRPGPRVTLRHHESPG